MPFLHILDIYFSARWSSAIVRYSSYYFSYRIYIILYVSLFIYIHMPAYLYHVFLLAALALDYYVCICNLDGNVLAVAVLLQRADCCPPYHGIGIGIFPLMLEKRLCRLVNIIFLFCWLE